MNLQGRIRLSQDDDFSHAYIPSAEGNSRSRSMKKVIKKTNSNGKTASKPKNDLDLLDQLLSSEKYSNKNEKNTTKKQANPIETDSFLDEISFPKSRFNISNNESRPISIANSGNLINDRFQSRGLLQGKPPELEKKQQTPQQTFRKSEDSPEIRPSSRQMKPPLRKRQKTEKSNLNISEKLTLHEEDEQYTSKKSSSFTPELNKRRSSIEQKTQLKIQRQKSNKLVSLQKFSKKQEGSAKYGIKIFQPQNFKHSFDLQQSNNDNILNTNQSLQEKSLVKNNEQLQKQLQFFKKSYEKHIQQLQSNLYEQVSINKQTRVKIMKEADEIIEIQKNRLEKLHDQQLKRVKQIMEWERKRIQQNYQDQIESLKKQLELMSSFNGNNSLAPIQINNREFKEAEIKIQKQLLQERERSLSERQLNIQTRERQLQRRIYNQEARLRELQKKILYEESQIKRESLDQRKILEKQKQSVAVQLTTLQLQYQKKAQKFEQSLKELQVEREQFEKERQLSRNLNNQIIQSYKQKQLELNEQKKRIYQQESQLISNIQIVQAMRMVMQGDFIKENNQTNDDRLKRVKSVNKILHKKKLESTKDRFHTITQNIKENLRNEGNGGKFDIDKYMAGMSKYSRNGNTWV